MKLKLLALASAATLALVVRGPTSAQKKGGDVVIAQTQAPPSLDPHVTSAQAARNVNLHCSNAVPRDEMRGRYRSRDGGRSRPMA